MSCAMIGRKLRVAELLFSIDYREVEIARRGFGECDRMVGQRLEGIGRQFLDGYHAALHHRGIDELGAALEAEPRETRGFAYEGAGMALALLDQLAPWCRNRLSSFLQGPGQQHMYTVHVGAGWAWARLRFRRFRDWNSLDPLLGWLALDGYGFHEGYFHPERTVGRGYRPLTLRSDELSVFDSGVGRSLWFVCGAEPSCINDRIERLQPSRHPDLWAGVGLAGAYAGGVSDAALIEILERSGPHFPSLAQGAAFAAKARERAENGAEHTHRAVERWCSMSAESAAAICDRTLAQLPRTNGGEKLPRFELWRRALRAAFAFPVSATGRSLSRGGGV